MSSSQSLETSILAVCPVSDLILTENATLNILEFELNNNKYIHNDEILKIGFGEDYVEFLHKNPCFKYYNKKEILTEYFQTDDFRLIAIYMVDILSMFLNVIWLVKDNSINIKRLVIYDKSKIDHDLKLISFTTATGEFVKTKLNQNEIDKAEELFYKLNYSNTSIFDPKIISYKNKGYVSSDTFAKLHNSYDRIGHAFNFIVSARSESAPIPKLAFMIAAFECLFSNSNIAINDQLKRRVPEYIGSDQNDKKDIRNCINQAYDIRSRYFHGDEVKHKYNSRDKTVPISIRLDTILRKVLVKIIEEDLESFKDRKLFENLLKRLEPQEKAFNKLIRIFILRIINWLKNIQTTFFPSPIK